MKTIYLALAIFFALLSCSKKDEETTQPEENIYAFTVGNSWVYKYYTKDPNTDEYTVFSNRTDSLKIIGSEVINNQTYYKYKTKTVQTEENGIPEFNIGTFEGVKYFRDSLGYLVDDSNKVYFWKDNYSERFWHSGPNQEIDIFAKLNEQTSDIIVEAGNFDSANLEIYAKNIETDECYPIASNFYYADGVGEIKKRIGYLSTGTTSYEKRLDSFHVE